MNFLDLRDLDFRVRLAVAFLFLEASLGMIFKNDFGLVLKIAEQFRFDGGLRDGRLADLYLAANRAQQDGIKNDLVALLGIEFFDGQLFARRDAILLPARGDHGKIMRSGCGFLGNGLSLRH